MGKLKGSIKPDFLVELVHIYEDEHLPMLVGGGFTTIRCLVEKLMITLTLGDLLFLCDDRNSSL
jgi:hypothetical protein